MGKRVSFIISQVERELLLGIIRRGENWRARQRAQTLIYLDDGQSMSEVAAMVGVNVRTVGSTRTAWLDCGEQSLYDAPRCGAPHKLNPLDLQRIMALAADQPLTANAVLALHVDAGGPPVHVATLTSALKTAGFVWKRTRASLKKRNEAAFRAAQVEITALRDSAAAGEIVLAYADEVGFSQVHPNRSAWTPKGQRHLVAASRGKRLNLLAAMTSTGQLFSAKLWQTTTSDAFVGFLGLLKDSLAHLCKPIVVILDNASIHKAKANQSIIEFLAKQGLTLFFLPPYSPELNRIERLWHKIKYTWMAVKCRDSHTLEADVTHIADHFGSKYQFAFEVNNLLRTAYSSAGHAALHSSNRTDGERPSMKLTRRQWMLMAGAGAAASGSWLWMRDASSSQKDIKTMRAFTDHMKTYCVGRFLIDVPASVRDVSGNYETQIASVEARPSAYKPALHVTQALDLQLEQREADLRSQPLSPRGSSRFLGALKGGTAVRVLCYLTPGVEPDGKADGYVARDGGVFFFQTNANDQNDATELLNYLVEIEPSLSMLAAGEIPRTPGFCIGIGTGLVATNPKRGENVNGWAWTLPGHPEVRFGISTRTNGDTVPPGALDREASILREAASLMHSIKTLRKRRFDLNGMAAQEWLVETTDNQPKYHFDIEVPGLANDNAHPFIKLNMTVGDSGENGYVKPSISTGGALALWDALIQTLRLRPGAM